MHVEYQLTIHKQTPSTANKASVYKNRVDIKTK